MKNPESWIIILLLVLGIVNLIFGLFGDDHMTTHGYLLLILSVVLSK